MRKIYIIVLHTLYGRVEVAELYIGEFLVNGRNTKKRCARYRTHLSKLVINIDYLVNTTFSVSTTPSTPSNWHI
jgi:hypothetical protein